MSNNYASLLVPQSSDPAWLLEFLRLVGTNERTNGQLIGDFFEATSLGRQRVDIPWCSATVNYVFKQLGLPRTNSAAARSWLSWGEPCEPRRGAVAVFSRDGGGPAAGHVGLWLAREAGCVLVLGGNQDNQVCVKPYSAVRLLDTRWAVPVTPGAKVRPRTVTTK